MNKTLKDKLEITKLKYKNTLVGKWSTIEGTYFISEDFFEFHQDGTGYWKESSMSGSLKTTFFKWSIEVAYTVQIKETKVVFDDNGIIEEFEEECEWDIIQYDFKIITNDCGQDIALCNIDSELFYFARLRIGLTG